MLSIEGVEAQEARFLGVELDQAGPLRGLGWQVRERHRPVEKRRSRGKLSRRRIARKARDDEPCGGTEDAARKNRGRAAESEDSWPVPEIEAIGGSDGSIIGRWCTVTASGRIGPVARGASMQIVQRGDQCGHGEDKIRRMFSRASSWRRSSILD